MRILPLVVLIGCTDAPWHPDCIASGRAHTCSNLAPRSCTQMFVMSGLRVDFIGGSPTDYDVVIDADDTSTAFACADSQVMPAIGDGAWFCDRSGFLSPVRGDHLTIAITADDATVTADVDPCWDISEPNGQCCGFAYSTTVEIAL
jgi:hypothetical protein